MMNCTSRFYVTKDDLVAGFIRHGAKHAPAGRGDGWSQSHCNFRPYEEPVVGQEQCHVSVLVKDNGKSLFQQVTVEALRKRKSQA